MDLLAWKLDSKVEKHQMEELQAKSLLKPSKLEIQGDDSWPLSGKPYFYTVLARSHVKPIYQLVFPAKMNPVLPSVMTPAVLIYRDKNWDTVYCGDHRCKKFSNKGWKAFVDDNSLKVGDACVFELMECSSKNLKFRVQILRGDIPSKLLGKGDGDSENTPIVIE